MTHYRMLFDPPDYMGVWDLDGEERIATIVSVSSGKVGGHSGKKASKKAAIKLREFDRPFLANVTNARTIAGMYGPDTTKWKGKTIALYETTTRFGSEEVACIRVRPMIPQGQPEHVGSRPVNEETQAKQDKAAGRVVHPAGAALKNAKTAEDLKVAIREHAAWIAESTARWDAVLGFADAVGLGRDDAVTALDEPTDAG